MYRKSISICRFDTDSSVLPGLPVGPVVEAFGYERILFGSSPSSSSRSRAHVGNWYDIARESLAELGIEQSHVDAVFFGNAQKVYGKK